MKMKRWIAMLCMITVCVQTSGCQSVQEYAQEIKEKGVDKQQEQAAFDAFLDTVFLDNIQSDSITLNYTLAHPENYGITDYTPTFGDYGVDAEKTQLVRAENIYDQLQDFAYTALTEDQQLTYDILVDYYKPDGDEEDYLLYGEALGNTTGIQAEIPILLSEYNIDDKEDLDHYLALLPEIATYFEQIETYEQEKSEAGLFMPKDNAEAIISQCEDFIKEPKKNLLISTFNDHIDTYDWLTKQEKTSYQKKNRKLVLEQVIPAYEQLITTLEALKDTGKYEGGIGNLPDGKTYYEKLAQSITGTDLSVKEMKKKLENTMIDAATTLNTIYSSDAEIDSKYMDMKFPLTDPDEILDYLKDTVKDDFPALEDVNYTVKYVDKSLEDHVSPAFYLTPQIDNYTENSIYINGASNNNLAEIFTTLAHEGYPGHLLQNVYFSQQNPDPVRATISYGGYSEGWATYTEMYSYNIAGLDENLGEFAKQYMIFNLCIYALVDIGVNYDCWDMEELTDFLCTYYGDNVDDAAEEIMGIVTDDPANYLQYVVGYISFMDLRSQAEKELGDSFSQKEFHTFLLDIGPASFPVIEKYMDKWIDTQK